MVIIQLQVVFLVYIYFYFLGAPPWSSGSVLDHRSLPPVFESRRGHIWRSFYLSLRLITFGGRSAHLAYLVHKSGRETSIIIIIIFLVYFQTSNALCFILYLLATNPEVQARLREEVDEVVQNNGLNVNPVGKMNYLDSVIKETLR